MDLEVELYQQKIIQESLLQKSEQPMHVVSSLNFVIQYNMFSTWSKVQLLCISYF